MSWRDKIAAVLAGKVGGPTPTGIHVYHSSPHDFDRFDLSKIGTGEGAQVYGHGIYAAENPAVSGQGGQYWQSFLHKFDPKEQERGAASYLSQVGFDRAKALKMIEEDIAGIQNSPVFADKSPVDQLRERARLIQSGAPVGPRTYEVNFRAKPEELLDWDKPLKQMSPEVQKRLNDAWLAHPDDHARMTGQGIYGSLEAKNWDSSKYRGAGKPYASQTLLDAGIPGIRYLDEGSRFSQALYNNNPIANAAREFVEAAGGNSEKAGKLFHESNPAQHWAVPERDEIRRLIQMAGNKPTHNYVAFDPSKLDIMAKYGVVGGVPLGAATMGGTIDQSTYGANQ